MTFVLQMMTSAHKTQEVANFLQDHPNVKLHFTPTYSSWLNQIEIWFSRIERDVIARGVFTSVGDLARKLIRYIRATRRPLAHSNGSTPICAVGFQHANEFTATLH